MTENDSYGDYSIDENDQPGVEDTLEGDDVGDPLDRGYSPPEGWSAAEGFGNTPYEEALGESFEQRLAQEEPEEDPSRDPDDESGEQDEQYDAEVDAEVGDVRAGRLVDLDEGLGEDTEKDLVGRDVGIDGAAASAEEAAVHVIPDDQV